MEPESLRGATEWYNHIELAGLFTIGVFTVGSAINIILQRWLGAKECKDCPTVKQNQATLRDIILPSLERSIAQVDKNLAIAIAKLDLLMKGLRLVGDDDQDWEGPMDRRRK